jgi:hypothetical protein
MLAKYNTVGAVALQDKNFLLGADSSESNLQDMPHSQPWGQGQV